MKIYQSLTKAPSQNHQTLGFFHRKQNKTFGKSVPDISKAARTPNACWDPGAPWFWHFPGNTEHPDPHQGPPRMGEEAAFHSPPRGVPKWGTSPLLSLFKGNTTHCRRLMPFISSASSNWKKYIDLWVKYGIAATLCTLLSICLKTLKSPKVDREGRKFVIVELH